MPIHDPDKAQSQLVAFAARTNVLHVHAQAQARAILKRTGTPVEEWPNFDVNLDERLHHIAHRLLWGAFELLEAEAHQTDACNCLVQGAEALEFLYADTNMPAVLRTEELIKASFAYYIGGHSARAYVLINETIDQLLPIPPLLQLAVAVLRRDLLGARDQFITVFANSDVSDDTIAEQLADGSLTDKEALTRILTRATASAVCCFLEYVKTGDRACFTEALAVINEAIDLAREYRMVDAWWWAFCIRFLFHEMDDNSFWKQLVPLGSGGDSDQLIGKYIGAGLRQKTPIIELWPSQKRAVATICDTDRTNFCLRMPTSSGKTRIAELTILQFLIDKREAPDSKCVYIAPFRSLAVEIEKSLKRSVEPLGERVSEVYGGFELSPPEQLEVAESRILVATPEKFDALLRFVPEIGDDIGLVIIDEGHIVDPNERGLRFEILIQRLLKRFQPQGCRFLFISAVLPNAEQFSEWLTGSSDNLVRSDWRPSRLMLGRLDWNGTRMALSYTHRGEERLKQECFIRRFVDSRECKGVPGFGLRRKPFPRDYREARAAATLAFALDGAVLVFVPQAQHVASVARDLLKAAESMEYLAAHEGEEFSVPVPGRDTELWTRCKDVITEELGEDSELLEFLDKGIVVHHGKLPRRVRLVVEEVVREGASRIVVATTTLGQGVNLPIKTVIVRGLSHGYGREVNPLTFWNICGRAGRAMRENEGQILFCCDGTEPQWKRRKRNESIDRVISTLQDYLVESALKICLEMILSYWSVRHGSTDMAELCERLANNDISWLEDESERNRIAFWLDTLDGHMLTLAEELAIDSDLPDRLQEVLQGSLLALQMRDDKDTTLTPETAVAVLHARVRHVCTTITDKAMRTKMYKLGMTLTSCLFIEERREQLETLLRTAVEWDVWTDFQRADFLVEFATMLCEIQEIRPRELPKESNEIIRLWLLGWTANEIAGEVSVQEFTTEPSEVALFIEDLCGYRLPWGANSVLAYILEFQEDGESSLPEACKFIASFFKFGMVSPVATCIMPRIDNRRDLAQEAARACPHDYSNTKNITVWFSRVDQEELVQSGIDEPTAFEIIEARDARERLADESTSKYRDELIHFEPSMPIPEDVKRLGRVVLQVHPWDSQRYHVFSLSGHRLGAFHRESDCPAWWQRGDLCEAIVEEILETEGSNRLAVRTREL